MNKSLRINFDESEHENVLFLMKHMGYGTPQKLIRFLVADRSTQVREFSKRYGPKGPSDKVPTQAERRNKLEAMSDADLNAELESLHAFDEYKSGPDMLVFVDTDTLGRRILRQRSANEDNETPLAMFLNQLKNKKII